MRWGKVRVLAVMLVVGVARGAAAEEGEPAGKPGTLVVTELMALPPAVLEFPLGQWFEVYNSGDAGMPLAGVTIEVGGADAESLPQVHVVGGLDLPEVGPHEFAVLGASKAQAVNGGILVAYSYGKDLVLPKQGGTITLKLGNETLDTVTFGPAYGMGATAGASVTVEPGAMDALANDQAGAWCVSVGLVANANVEEYGSPGGPGNACDTDADGYTEVPGEDGKFDCDDADPLVGPGMQEKCNGKDDDCNGETDEEPLADAPAWPGVGVCAEAGSGPLCGGAAGWSTVWPAAYQEIETLCDGLDNDCDGEADGGLKNACGECGGALADVCDGLDNDCDGVVDEDAGSPPRDTVCAGAGTGVCATVAAVCSGELGWTCVYPVGHELVEQTCDGVDNDCNGVTDTDAFPELGGVCSVGLGACWSEGIWGCGADGKSLVCEAVAGLGAQELCGDDVDNDCDGETDEGFPLGESCTVGTGACQVTGKYFCSEDGLSVVCSATVLEPDEVCGNGVDDDCDGETDEADCVEVTAELPVGCGTGAGGSSLTILLLLLTLPLLSGGRRVKTPRR